MPNVVVVDHFGQCISVLVRIPKRYVPFIRCLLYRRFALAKILHHNSELKIKPYSLWVTFAQNFLYVDRIWKVLLKEAAMVHRMHANWTSTTFEKYVVTEALVRRHEPVYVSQYRACRTNDMPNLSQATANLETMGMCFKPVQCFP